MQTIDYTGFEGILATSARVSSRIAMIAAEQLPLPNNAPAESCNFNGQNDMKPLRDLA
jgi:hypothetical protein